MAANQPLSGNRTVVFKDKVIDSRITKKAKRKTISLADILQTTAQDDKIKEPEEPPITITDEQDNRYPLNDPQPPVQQYLLNYAQPPVHQYPSNYPQPPVQQYPSSYQNPSAQQFEEGKEDEFEEGKEDESEEGKEDEFEEGEEDEFEGEGNEGEIEGGVGNRDIITEEGKEEKIEGGGKQFEDVEDGEDMDDGRQEKRKERDKVKRFSLDHSSEEDIEWTLATIHDTQGHSSKGITAGRASGRHHWTIRTCDIGLLEMIVPSFEWSKGSTPAEIPLKYNPITTHFEPSTTPDCLASSASMDEVLGYDANQFKYFTMKWTGHREYATCKLSHSLYTKELKLQPKWYILRTIRNGITRYRDQFYWRMSIPPRLIRRKAIGSRLRNKRSGSGVGSGAEPEVMG